MKRNLDDQAKIFSLSFNKKDTSIFRLTTTFKNKIDEKYLRQALDRTLKKYKEYKVKLNKDLFWYYLEENEKIVVGNGSACIITFQAAIIKKGQRLFANSGCASMGYGLPAAIGAAIPLKGQRLICLDGDGSIQMNIQELATLSYHKLNLKLFLYLDTYSLSATSA